MWIVDQSRGRRRGGVHLGNADAMPDSPEQKRSANPALFVGGLSELFADESAARSPTAKSPVRSFDASCGKVGLGIVAAMSGPRGGSPLPLPPPPPPRSEPIPIGLARAAAEPKVATAKEEEEFSESYTCVIWHVGGNLTRKRVYFEEASVF